MRRQHWLPGNQKVELPSYMVFVDTESKIVPLNDTIDKHYLWFGSALFIHARTKNNKSWLHEESFEFTDAASFWSWLTSKAYSRCKLYVYAHNWNYDAGILSLATLPKEDGWDCTGYINDKPPFIMTLKKDKRVIQFVDTLNYFPTSLKALGESIGSKKLPYPADNADDDTWREYNLQDVRVIKDAVLALRDFIKEHEMGNMKVTLASQAFTAYRHRFMPEKILIHDDEEVCKLERLAFYGGRSEAFYIGDYNEPLYYLDINSMYPYIMRTYPLPTRLGNRLVDIPLELLSQILETRAVIAQVELITDEPVYPVRYEHRLTFPIGNFITTLSTPELKYALNKGHIKRVIKGAKYHQGILFKEYVDYLYSVRLKYRREENPVFSHVAKLLLNSCYGRFGMNGQVWEYARDAYDDDFTEWANYNIDTKELLKFRKRLGVIQVENKQGESYNSFPGIAAHITAYGRMYLWDLMKTAGRENVLYTDTDSLIVTEPGYNALLHHINAVTLGALKLETQIKNASFYSPKDYVINEIRKIKGIKANATQLSVNTWTHEIFRSWDWLLKQDQDGYIQVEHSQKVLSRKHKKSKLLPSGWTQPYSVPEDIIISGIV